MSKLVTDLLAEQPNACCVPFTQMVASVNENAITPCCKFTGSVGAATDQWSKVWFGSKMKKLREDMISGEPNEACGKCYPDTSRFTYREMKNARLQNILRNEQVSVDDPYPRVLDVTTGNTCNLACRMCFAGSSSKIEALATPAMRPYVGSAPSRVNVDLVIGDLDFLKEVKYLVLTGGEPFLEKNTIKILEAIKQHSTVEKVHLSTNMSTFNKQALGLLASLRCGVSLSISIDGDEETHEYIRVFSKINNIKENVKRIEREYPGVFTYEVNTTVSAMNAFRTDRTLRFLYQFEEECNIKFSFMMVVPIHEPHNHPGILPKAAKEILHRVNTEVSSWETRIPGSEKLAQTAMTMAAQSFSNADFASFMVLMREYDKLSGMSLRKTLWEIFE